MIHQGKEQPHEISHQIVTQPELLTPQYIVSTKNMMQQPTYEPKVIFINTTQTICW